MDLSSDVFSTFFSYYWNFDIGMFVLRSSISLEASKKKNVWITNKQKIQVSICWEAGVSKTNEREERLSSTKE